MRSRRGTRERVQYNSDEYLRFVTLASFVLSLSLPPGACPCEGEREQESRTDERAHSHADRFTTGLSVLTLETSFRLLLDSCLSLSHSLGSPEDEDERFIPFFLRRETLMVMMTKHASERGRRRRRGRESLSSREDSFFSQKHKLQVSSSSSSSLAVSPPLACALSRLHLDSGVSFFAPSSFSCSLRSAALHRRSTPTLTSSSSSCLRPLQQQQ